MLWDPPIVVGSQHGPEASTLYSQATRLICSQALLALSPSSVLDPGFESTPSFSPGNCMEGKSDFGDMIRMSRPSREHRASKKRKLGLDRSSISDIAASEISEGRSGLHKDRRASRAVRNYSSRGRGGRGASRATRPWRSADNSISPTLAVRKKLKVDTGNVGSAQIAAVNVPARRPPGRPRLKDRRVEAVVRSPEEDTKSPDIGAGTATESPAAEDISARRALRPRPSVTKSVTKRNKPFKQVTLKQEDGARIVGRRLKVYWPLDSKWYYGEVKAYCPVRERHRVVYDDKDEEWLDLQREDFKLQVHDWEAVGESGALLAAAAKAPTASGGKRTRRRFKGRGTKSEGSSPSPSGVAESDGTRGDLQQAFENASHDDSELSGCSDSEDAAVVSKSSGEATESKGVVCHQDAATVYDSSEVTSRVSSPFADVLCTGSGDQRGVGHAGPLSEPGSSLESRLQDSNGDATCSLEEGGDASRSTGKPRVLSVYSRRSGGVPKSASPAARTSSYELATESQLRNDDPNGRHAMVCMDMEGQGQSAGLDATNVGSSECEAVQQAGHFARTADVRHLNVIDRDGSDRAHPDLVEHGENGALTDQEHEASDEIGHGRTQKSTCAGNGRADLVDKASGLHSAGESNGALADANYGHPKEVEVFAKSQLLIVKSVTKETSARSLAGSVGISEVASPGISEAPGSRRVGSDKSRGNLSEDYGQIYTRHSRKRKLQALMVDASASVSQGDVKTACGTVLSEEHACIVVPGKGFDGLDSKTLEIDHSGASSSSSDTEVVLPDGDANASEEVSPVATQCLDLVYKGPAVKWTDTLVSDVRRRDAENHVIRSLSYSFTNSNTGSVLAPVPSRLVISLGSPDASQGLRVEASLGLMQSIFTSMQQLLGSRLPLLQLQSAVQPKSLESSADHLQLQLLNGSRVDLELCVQALRRAGMDLSFLPQTSFSIEFQRNGTTSTSRVSPFILRSALLEATDVSMLSDSAVRAGDSPVIVPSQWSSRNPASCGSELQGSAFPPIQVSQARSTIIGPSVKLLVLPASLTCLGFRIFYSASGENCPLTVFNSLRPHDIRHVDQLASLLRWPNSRTSPFAPEVPRRLGFTQGRRQLSPDYGTAEVVSLLHRVNNQLGRMSEEIEWRITLNSWRLFQNAFGVNSVNAQAPVLASGNLCLPHSAVADMLGDLVSDCSVEGASYSGTPRNGLHSVSSLSSGELADSSSPGAPVAVCITREEVQGQHAGSLKRALEEAKQENQESSSSEVEEDSLSQRSSQDLVVSKRLKHEAPAKPAVEALPRFKLRRCPTNKEWGIARDSQIAKNTEEQSAAKLLKQRDADCERPAGDAGEVVQPSIPRSEVSRKRPLVHGPDMPSERSNEAEATCSSCGAAVGSCHHSEVRKRRRKGSSPVSGDELEGVTGKGRCSDSATIRQIPIPGVREVEECPGRACGDCFVRPPLEYIRQRESEEDMVSHSNRVIYDMDSEDEEWLMQTNVERTSGRGSRSRPKITEETLERAIDKLEKVSFSELSEVAGADAAADLCHGFASPEVIKAIHSYWLAKRHRKGMALIRHFQAAPWQQYQKLVKEWEYKLQQLQVRYPVASQKQLMAQCKAPAQFAFCLRPKGLDSSKTQRKSKRTAGETRRKRLRNLQQLDQQMQQESPMEMDLDLLLREEAAAESLREAAKEAAELARALRTRAELMYAQADASMFTAVQLVIEADCMQAAENAANEALQQEWEQDFGYQTECSQEFPLKYSEGFDASNHVQAKTAASQEPIKGPSFGSWRKGLENPTRSSNSLRPIGTRQSLINDSDDPLLPVASWSQELGAGLGTRLIAKGDASPLDL